MDPPDEAEALELASLIEETISDNVISNNDNDGVGGVDAPPSRSQFRSPTAGYSQRNNNNFRRSPRSSAAPPSASDNDQNNNNQNNASQYSTTYFGFFSRQALLLLNLAGVVLLLMIIANKAENANETDAAEKTFEVHHGHLSPPSSSSQSQHSIGFHEPSLENIYGANHYFKPKGVGYPNAPRGGLHPIYMVDIMIGEGNDDNNTAAEYYNDDYELSPYADERLKLTKEERITEQQEWKQKLQDIRDNYGYWDFKDDYKEKNKGKDRPVVDWATVVGEKKKLGEVDKDDFPKDAWQTDDEYVTNVLNQGKKLIKRVQDGIYEEYGWESADDQRNKGGIHIPDATTGGGSAVKGGVAWMYEKSFNALVKKLLNAMMTNDHFFVTLGGHSAAAGHGNNFHQGYMMEFQHIMEPVFDRLGMVLVSANLAQGGMGTLQAALAGTGIYGFERDFVLWDSSMTEKDGKAQDLFMRQALLSGQRVPILFDMGGGKASMEKIRNEAGAHFGGVSGGGLNPKFKNATTFNFAENKYNAACWTDRVDIKPDVQYPGFGGQASWHPGNWVHQSTARKISLLFLHAMDEALTLWEKAASSDGNPLDGKHWHLQSEEDTIRDTLKKANATNTECGKLFDFIPRVCTSPMKGAAEWAPRHNPDHSSIRSLVKPAPNGYVPGVIDIQEQAYPGRDPHIPTQRVFKGEVDVAAIARSLAPRNSKRRRSLSSTNSLGAYHGRYLDVDSVSDKAAAPGESKIIPGEGWTGKGHPAGFCDGTSNAICYREKSSHCLMSGHNDARGMMQGDGLSGWLVLELKDVTEGIFMARMESYHPYNSNKRTEGWKAVNNGRDDGRRKLKAPPPPLLPTFLFEVAVNGVIQSSWNSTEYQAQCHYISYNNAICVLWDDEQWPLKNEKEDVEFAIRLGGDGSRADMMALTHVYYA
mmetsp:Transcript_23939/g.51692  ORF Transcript_23939/g.51692 Transcript_23939/m.51692 type:complete len:928 (+) Transcript_23939:79-2862(+)